MSKALIAYFTASGQGVTKKVAERLANAVAGDLYEIQPEAPYTEADLDWNDEKSRSTIEIKNPDARPAIAGPVPDMADYDVLFVGFPIWWGRHPSVVDTFLEALDLAGKTVVPFATSGESEIGESGAIMQKVVPAAKVAVGKRFPNDVTEEELKAFAEDYL